MHPQHVILFYHIFLILLYSITKQQQEQQPHVYDFISTNPLATGVYNRPVKKSLSSNDDSITMAVNPAYSDFTNNTITNDEDTDLEYEVMDAQTSQVKTDDVKTVTNPAYAETKFN